MTINMILLWSGNEDGKVRFVPAHYDMEKKTGKVLEQNDAGPFNDFARKALSDMDDLVNRYIMEYTMDMKDSGIEFDDKAKADMLVRLLASFSERPMEMIGNMLAANIITCVDELLVSDDFDELSGAWIKKAAETE